MSENFGDISIRLKNIIDCLDKNKEYEFHFNSASGTDVTSRFGDLENIQYHNDESLTVTCIDGKKKGVCLLYTSPSPRDRLLSRMPSSA